jgi:ATP-binding cassette subfamily C protein
VGIVFLFSVFTNLLMLTGPLFMLQVYDRVLAARSEETLVALFGLVAGLYALYGLLEFSRSRVMSRVAARFQAELNGRVFGAMLEQSARRSGARSGSLHDLDAIRAFFVSPVFLAIVDIPWTPVFIVAIFVFHPLLGWLALTGGAILIAAALANQILTARRAQESAGLQAAAGRFSGAAEEVSGYLWAQGMQETITARWQDMQNAAVAELTRVTDRTGGFSAFTRAFRLFLQSAMLAVGAYLVLRNELTAGAMIAASILLGRALAPVEVAVSQWPVAQRARIGWRNLSDLMATMPSRAEPTDLPPPNASLSVRNITTVARPGDPPVLRGISFDVRPGEAIGIIGRSGSGKTTLARVMTGLLRPAMGEVRLDGATLDQYGPERLGKYLGYLPQDVSFLEGTIAENIAQMALVPDAARVVAAAKEAHVHDIILNLPDGYDTRIGAQDAQLSGGQKQRLALARALYGKPVLLVLDEPNSALDADGLEALNAAVAAMKAAGKAVLIMTHRPTAISTCDKLLVLDGGKVAGFGPRDEVVRTMIANATDVQRLVGAKR